MAELYSYHIFLFPFKWEVAQSSQPISLQKRMDLSVFEQALQQDKKLRWKNQFQPPTEIYRRELYNEKNFFYDFVRTALYDNNESKEQAIVKHYEWGSAEGASYHIVINYKENEVPKQKEYILHINSICLNVYATGVATLAFYLENRESSQTELTDILRINQYGRRIYPPFISTLNGLTGTKDAELAERIFIEGMGNPVDFFEDFSSYFPENTSSSEPIITWKTPKFIQSLLGENISDNADNVAKIKISQVLDDRMFVVCWYGNNTFSTALKTSYLTDDWYKYVFLDGNDITCHNQEMKEYLIKKHTNPRWQGYGTFYGVTRYSLVELTDASDFSKNVLLPYIRTMYFRMAELSLVQRASVLKFSEMVTEVSHLQGERSKIAEEVSFLYQSYIRFVNKVYFREVTPQEQGIEIYDKLQEVMRVPDHVKDLDKEIEELHGYASLLEEKHRSEAVKELNEKIAELMGKNVTTSEEIRDLNKANKDILEGMQKMQQKDKEQEAKLEALAEEDRKRDKQLAIITKIGAIFLIPSFVVAYYGLTFLPDDFKFHKPCELYNFTLNLGLVTILLALILFFDSIFDRIAILFLGRVIRNAVLFRRFLRIFLLILLIIFLVHLLFPSFLPPALFYSVCS